MALTNQKTAPARVAHLDTPPRRCTRYEDEPSYYEAGALWLYGNVRLLHAKLSCIETAFGPGPWDRSALDEIEQAAERRILNAEILVCGVHNEAHQRAAVVPLRWGAPRVIVFSGGIRVHLGDDLKNEPFRAARLWRYQWDSRTDLAVSRRAPHKLPTFSRFNPTVDRLIRSLADGDWPGLSSPVDPLTRSSAPSSSQALR
ncbi:MAG: hypothetical protein JST30_09705 [Armatimonadetes bacterium]|nr:hypothetical protein [Armatimonadota bacterium]